MWELGEEGRRREEVESSWRRSASWCRMVSAGERWRSVKSVGESVVVAVAREM